MYKRFILVPCLSCLLVGVVNLESPAYPAMDSCSAAMIGLAFYHAAYASCASAEPPRPCLNYYTAMVNALFLVDELCEFNS